ncbi:FkbM family methyltransferase [Auraticoccus monumenti]|uniref:Methyltransferase, FkbM family n=1 Tax=Auraticoccus monumenti TaxID=675864 RepID=A0A1G7F588_9ACTN|nr:FkbM family methyltransferase [Auraticoccus monumenti]SDD03234.1 methyltransferase, FkbM family [Auraticoccus monumenti]SDE71013.1 methyltransferase, FkbM family [Auraticoccus monumenti]SDE71052.1 methyltransferase, FkbM family [Auraticoccus monumenti]
MAKVFLDIGAHIGETLAVVRDPKWHFDRIVCFEPAPVCWPRIEALADERVEICRFGLWSEDATMTLHNPGDVGASTAFDKNPITDSADCAFRDAAVWFAENVSDSDQVYAKINVEGAEADLIDRLFGSGELAKIDHLLVHFDVRKAPSLSHREPAVRAQLVASGVDFQSAEEIQFGGVIRGTRNWLQWVEGNRRTRDLRFKVLRRREHAVRRRLYPLKQRLLRSDVDVAKGERV